MSKKVIILGAGLAGLSCAFHLKRDYDIYEKESEPGGLCRSHKQDGFIFDYAGHLLHFKTRYFLDLARKLLRGNLACHNRSAWIYYSDTFIPYPFQANINFLPRGAAEDCLRGIALRKDRPVRHKGNFYEWMQQKFGAGIVKHFMLPYNLKFWRSHPKNLNCDWIEGKVPFVPLEDYVAGTVRSSSKKWGYNWRFWYPQTGGIAALPLALEKEINRINYNHNVKKIDIKKKVVRFDNSSCTKFDYLVSTLPLPELGEILSPIPERVQNAIRSLNFLSIFNLNLGISQNHFDKHWIYFPENKPSFYRLGFFSNFSPNSAPPGKASIYTEVSYAKNHSFRASSLVDRIILDLLKTKIIKRKAQVANKVVNNLKYGYIIYDRQYCTARETVIEFLRKNKIFSIGRFGSWRYLSMEESMIDGKIAAESLNRTC